MRQFNYDIVNNVGLPMVPTYLQFPESMPVIFHTLHSGKAKQMPILD